MIPKITCAQPNKNNSRTSFGMTYSGAKLLSMEEEIKLLIKYSKKAINGEVSAIKTNTEEKFYASTSGEEIKMLTPGYFALSKIEIKHPDTDTVLFIKRPEDKPEVKKEFERLAALLYNETKKLFKPIVPEKQTWLDKLLNGKNKV